MLAYIPAPWIRHGMWVKQCHKPPMTGNGLFIPPTKNGEMRDGLWHCFTHITPFSLFLAGCPAARHKLNDRMITFCTTLQMLALFCHE